MFPRSSPIISSYFSTTQFELSRWRTLTFSLRSSFKISHGSFKLLSHIVCYVLLIIFWPDFCLLFRKPLINLSCRVVNTNELLTKIDAVPFFHLEWFRLRTLYPKIEITLLCQIAHGLIKSYLCGVVFNLRKLRLSLFLKAFIFRDLTILRKSQELLCTEAAVD